MHKRRHQQQQAFQPKPDAEKSHQSHQHKSDHGPTDLSAWIVQVGIAVNLGLAVIKLVGGWAFSSKSLTADGWHSMTDLVTDLLALISVLVIAMPKLTEFLRPTVSNVEGSISLTISGLLVLMGIHEGWESLVSFHESFFGQALLFGERALGYDSHSDIHHDVPSLQAAWIAGLTILAKEWLYHKTMKIAAETKSSVLASNAVHQRADSLMSMVTVVAILGSNIFKDTAWIDSVGGLCISAIVIRAALENLTKTIKTWKSAD
uniref:Cation efflux protein transmembrane domain-containing protein n=1 Tax=Bionectria ochroleuca TaxID=29856 RepID=A0A8H7TQC3_BIOOC